MDDWQRTASNLKRQIAALEGKKLFLIRRCRSYDTGYCAIDDFNLCVAQCLESGYFIEDEGTNDEVMVRTEVHHPRSRSPSPSHVDSSSATGSEQ